MSFLVYKHTNKENGKVYIGITSQEPKRRWQNGAGYYGTYFYNAIQKYGWDGFEHEILLEGLTKEQAEEIETDLIAKYGSANRENGYNVSLGAKYEKIRLGVKKYGKENHRINDACEYAKVSHSCIGRYVKGTRNDATGRRWFYDITLD